jgi:Glycosyltransferase sugar-binding region containing DXD motif
MTDKLIFTFWEPRDSVVPYLALCLKTWEMNLPEYKVVVLDYSNLDRYLGGDVYDMHVLRRLALPQQKDAISVAVLKEHGGIFMDIDTLVFRDLDPILRKLEETQFVMFGTHMAFFAAKPNSHFLTLWLAKIQERLSKLGAKSNLPWDYIGNNTLNAVLDDMLHRSTLYHMQSESCRRLGSLAERVSKRMPQAARLLNKLCAGFRTRRKLELNTLYAKYLTSLDREKYSYILEAREYVGQNLGSKAKYIKFWFEGNLDLDAVLGREPILVGLHNSWTPAYYKELSERQVLENPCLLSRTLNQVLSTAQV